MAKAAASLASPGTSAIVKRDMPINGMDDLERIARVLFAARGNRMPNVERWETVAAVIMAGLEIGLGPNQAIDSIMISKTGKLTIWGDGALALVKASGLMQSHKEWVEGHGEDRAGYCDVQRVGEDLRTFKFSVADANKAGLIERAKGQKGDGPWITYQDRMLVMRARSWALRDVFPDAIRGLVPAEEQMDAESTTAVKVTVTQVQDTPAGGTAGSAATATPVNADVMVTDDQLQRIVQLRELVVAAKNLKTKDEISAAWSEVLKEHGGGATSAKSMTTAQAGEFIAALEKIHDPFASGQTATETPPAAT